jgi:hypothetical protein
MRIKLIQPNCSMGEPLLDYTADREQLAEWARRKGDASLKQCLQEKNRTSLEGKPTFFPANTGCESNSEAPSE